MNRDKILARVESPDFDAVAQSWEKWEAWLQPSYESLNRLLMQKAGISPKQCVLDVGCGIGYVSIEVARLVGRNGQVIGIDVSEGMLAVAKRRVEKSGMSNLQFQNQDAQSLPFRDEMFDAAISRFCLMFVPSPKIALREIMRVLKPGARFAASVWCDPKKNPLPRTVLERYFTLPPDDPKAPGPYRFSQNGTLAHLMKDAGFVETIEEEVRTNEVFTSGAQYVDHILESSALWGGLLRELNVEKLTEAQQALAHEAEQYRVDSEIQIPRAAIVVSGKKPSS